MEGKKRPKAKPAAGMPAGAIAALPKQADGAIPADFLLDPVKEPSGLPAALLPTANPLPT